MKADSSLASKQAVCADDLAGLPLFCSEQGWNHDISKWYGNKLDEPHLEGPFRLSLDTYSHLYPDKDQQLADRLNQFRRAVPPAEEFP